MLHRFRWKLLATYLLVVATALIYIGTYLTPQIESAFTELLQDDLVELAHLMASNTVAGLEAGDDAAVRTLLQGAPNGADDLSVLVTDASGTAIAERGGGRWPVHPSIATALHGQEAVRVITAPGAERVYVSIPVLADGRILGAVQVARGLGAVRRQLAGLWSAIAWSAAGALVLAGLLGLILARNIAGPLQDVQRIASRLAAGHLGERVPIRTHDEVGEMARALNYMASELERLNLVRQAFVADAAHELRTPVANLAVAAEALKSALRTDPRQAIALAAGLENEVERLRTLTERLLDLSIIESGEVPLHLAPQSPAEMVQRAVQPFQSRAEQAHITLTVAIAPRLPQVWADADRVVQVLSNLLDNALKFTPTGGSVTVSAYERRRHALISVADTGPGISQEELPHIYDRFYKIDRARRGAGAGAGLGLAIAKRLVEAQGGLITVDSEAGKGTRIVIALPKKPPLTQL